MRALKEASFSLGSPDRRFQKQMASRETVGVYSDPTAPPVWVWVRVRRLLEGGGTQKGGWDTFLSYPGSKLLSEPARVRSKGGPRCED